MNTFCHKLAASIRNLIHTVYGRRRRDQVLSTPDISEKVLSGAYTPCPHMVSAHKGREPCLQEDSA